MAIILAVAVVLGWGVHTTTKMRKNLALGQRFVAWTSDLLQDNPSLSLGGYAMKTSLDIRGPLLHAEANYTTPAGRKISLELDDSRLAISAEGRTVTWPAEDVERGRKIDLKAEFPEAFR